MFSDRLGWASFALPFLVWVLFADHSAGHFESAALTASLLQHAPNHEALFPMLSQLFLALPLGSVAFRLALCSAWALGVACWLSYRCSLYLMVLSSKGQPLSLWERTGALLTCWGVGGALATLVPHVQIGRDALYAVLWIVICERLLAVWARQREPRLGRTVLQFCAFLGVVLVFIPIVALAFFPGFLLILWRGRVWRRKFLPRWKSCLLTLVFVCVGCSLLFWSNARRRGHIYSKSHFQDQTLGVWTAKQVSALYEPAQKVVAKPAGPNSRPAKASATGSSTLLGVGRPVWQAIPILQQQPKAFDHDVLLFGRRLSSMSWLYGFRILGPWWLCVLWLCFALIAWVRCWFEGRTRTLCCMLWVLGGAYCAWWMADFHPFGGVLAMAPLLFVASWGIAWAHSSVRRQLDGHRAWLPRLGAWAVTLLLGLSVTWHFHHIASAKPHPVLWGTLWERLPQQHTHNTSTRKRARKRLRRDPRLQAPKRPKSLVVLLGELLERSLPRDAFVITGHTSLAQTRRYRQFVEGLRPDILLLQRQRLLQPRYAKAIQERYPAYREMFQRFAARDLSFLPLLGKVAKHRPVCVDWFGALPPRMARAMYPVGLFFYWEPSRPTPLDAFGNAVDDEQLYKQQRQFWRKAYRLLQHHRHHRQLRQLLFHLHTQHTIVFAMSGRWRAALDACQRALVFRGRVPLLRKLKKFLLQKIRESD